MLSAGPSSNNIDLSFELGKLFGYFLAEGDISFDKRKGRNVPSAVRFSFSIKEDEYVNDVINCMWKVFGVSNYRISKFDVYNSQRLRFIFS